MTACEQTDSVKPGQITPSMMHQLIINLGNAGVTRSSLQHTTDRRQKLQRVAAIMMEGSEQKVFRYGCSMESLIKAGGYTSVDHRINSDNFNFVEPTGTPGSVILPANFAIAHTSGGLQGVPSFHANLAEFLVLGATNTSLQHGFPIVCMPTYARSLSLVGSKGVFVPTLTVAGTERVLTLAELDADLGTLRLWGGVHTGPWAIAVC